MTIRTWCLLALLAASTGCASLVPDYARPAPPVPGAWPAARGSGSEVAAPGAKAVAETPWREFFLEDRLKKLIALALENNRDLRVALLAMERSEAQYRLQRAGLFPKVEASGGGNIQRVPGDFSGTGGSADLHQYTLGLGVAAYELDVFGRVRSLKDQALQQYLASGEAQRSLRISLVSQVAAAYLNLAADRERLALARETLSSHEESYQLAKSRFDAGVSSALDLQQARTSVEAARVDIARYATLAAQDENALNLAAGSTVPAELLPRTLPEALTALQGLAPGLPSEVLLRRPDILQAENRLKGANANVGAARAAFFPRIMLTTSVGFGSSELSDLVGSGETSWRFVPVISVPIFDGGSNRATLKTAQVDRDLALAQYEKTVQVAFREVADALAQRGTIDDQLAAQQSLADAAAESLRLSQARYEKGVDSYLTVLDSQRALYVARQNLIGVRLARLANQAGLYRVLGGGATD